MKILKIYNLILGGKKIVQYYEKKGEYPPIY